MTRERPGAKGTGMRFSSIDEARAAYDMGVVSLQASVICKVDGERVETTVGRLLMYEIVPENLTFEVVNKVMDKKALGALIDICYRTCGQKATVLLADSLRTMGYQNATKAGISIAIKDMIIPDKKQEFIDKAQGQVQEIENQYNEGLITDGERYNKVIDIWSRVAEELEVELMDNIAIDTVIDEEGEEKQTASMNSVYIMADSGARGSRQQIKQLSGMRGLMAKPSGEIIETPITANFREGLSVLQYFISTHGVRKGLVDTALKTANSGYLTRRLVDVV
jgi:DNA-directed RNA polymerase subunit beta'